MVVCVTIFVACEREGPAEPVISQSTNESSSIAVAKDFRMLIAGQYAGSHHYTLYNNSDIQYEVTYQDTVLVAVSTSSVDSFRVLIDGHPADVLPDWSLTIGPAWWGWGAGEVTFFGTERDLSYFFHNENFPSSEEHGYYLHRL